ncbi:Pantoate-beta-alanine ligase [Gracilaria domingensis]|nr:Pantoate-beta-alanine ligase [Gracilaria domingensis]
MFETRSNPDYGMIPEGPKVRSIVLLREVLKWGPDLKEGPQTHQGAKLTEGSEIQGRSSDYSAGMDPRAALDNRQIITIRKPSELVTHLNSLPDSCSTGIVMTMGALHGGHAALVKQSVAENDITLVTLFANPLQFAPHEDFSTYPRTEQRDRELFQEWGADILFAPEVEQVYPPSFDTYVMCATGNPERNESSEGAFRPTFFRGVATIIAKTLSLTRADRCYFGLKDAQQCAVVKRIVEDLWLRCDVRLVDTQREEDGLAMSSRNAYLTAEERQEANALFKALHVGKKSWDAGMRDVQALRQSVITEIEKHPKLQLMYVSICDRWTMREMSGEMPSEHRSIVLCVAAMLGRARLIDNVVLAE